MRDHREPLVDEKKYLDVLFVYNPEGGQIRFDTLIEQGIRPSFATSMEEAQKLMERQRFDFAVIEAHIPLHEGETKAMDISVKFAALALRSATPLAVVDHAMSTLETTRAEIRILAPADNAEILSRMSLNDAIMGGVEVMRPAAVETVEWKMPSGREGVFKSALASLRARVEMYETRNGNIDERLQKLHVDMRAMRNSGRPISAGNNQITFEKPQAGRMLREKVK